MSNILTSQESNYILWDHPLWAVCKCLFYTYLQLPIISGGLCFLQQPDDKPCHGDINYLPLRNVGTVSSCENVMLILPQLVKVKCLVTKDSDLPVQNKKAWLPLCYCDWIQGASLQQLLSDGAGDILLHSPTRYHWVHPAGSMHSLLHTYQADVPATNKRVFENHG